MQRRFSSIALFLGAMACLAQAQVPHPPMMIKQPEHEQLFQVAQSQDETDKPFVLECEAEGTPEPE